MRRWLLIAVGLLFLAIAPVRAQEEMRARLEEGAYLTPYGRAFEVAFRIYRDGEEADLDDGYEAYATCRVVRGADGSWVQVPLDARMTEGGVIFCQAPPVKREDYSGRGNICHVELTLEYEGQQALKASHTLLLYDDQGLGAGPLALSVEAGEIFDCFCENATIGLDGEDLEGLIALEAGGDAVKIVPGQARLAAVQEGNAQVRCLAAAGVRDGEDLGMRDFFTANVEVTAAANPLPFSIEPCVLLEAGAEDGDEWVTLGVCDQAEELGNLSGWGEGVALRQLRLQGDEIQALLKAPASPRRAWVNLIADLAGRPVFVGPVAVVAEDERTAAGIPEPTLSAGPAQLGEEAALTISDAQGLDWLLGGRFREWVSWQVSGATESVTWRRLEADGALQYFFTVQAAQDVCLRVTHHIEDPAGRHPPRQKSASLWFTGDGQAPALSAGSVSARVDHLVLAPGQYLTPERLFTITPQGGLGVIYAARGPALSLEDGRVCALAPGEGEVCAWAGSAQARVPLLVEESAALTLERVEGPSYLLCGQSATLIYALKGGAVQRARAVGLGRTWAEAELLPGAGEAEARLRVQLTADEPGEARFQVEASLARMGIAVGQVLEASLPVLAAEPEPPFSALEVVALEGEEEGPLPALVMEGQPLTLRAYALDAWGGRMPLIDMGDLGGWQICAWGSNAQAGPWRFAGAYAQAEAAFTGAQAQLRLGLCLKSEDGQTLLKRELALYRPLVLKQGRALNRAYQLPQHRYIEAEALFGLEAPLSWRPALTIETQDGTLRNEGAGRLLAVKPGKARVALLGPEGETLWTLELTVTANEDSYRLEGAPALFEFGREKRVPLACIRTVGEREERIALDGQYRAELEFEGFAGGEARVEQGALALYLAAPQGREAAAGAYRVSLYRDRELLACQRVEAVFLPDGELPWFTSLERQLAGGPLLAGQAHGVRLLPVAQGEAGSLEAYEISLSAWGAARADFSPVRVTGGDAPCFAFEVSFLAPFGGEEGGMAAEIRYRGVVIGRFQWRDRVLAATLEGAQALAEPASYSGLAQTPRVSVSLNGAALRQGVDFEMMAQGEMVDAGRYPIWIEGRGDYAGRVDAVFEIVPKDLRAGVRMDEIEAQPYSPGAVCPAAALYDGDRRLTAGVDYALSYGDNRQVGKAWAEASGRGNYRGTLRRSFDIVPCPLSEEMVGAIGQQRYSARAVTPSVRVCHGQRVLTCKRDYDVSFLNNTNPGDRSALAVVTGLGNYQGRVERYFSIVKPSPPPPAAVAGVAPTVLDKPDGRLINLDEGMEYRSEGQKRFTQVPRGRTQVEGLAAGCYFVRRRATDLTAPGLEYQVEIEKGAGRLSVTFDPGGGQRIVVQQNLAYGEIVAPPQAASRPGYQSLGWYLGEEAWDFSRGVTRSITLNQRWAAEDGVPYRVEHCLETLDGAYACQAEDAQTLKGQAGGPTQAAARSYAGFAPEPIVQRAISGDGDTVVRVYYRRQNFPLVFLSDEGEVLWQGQMPFGAPIAPPAVRLKGRAFLGWDRQTPEAMPDQPLTFTALTRPAGLVFRVEHYHQAVEGDGYELMLTETVTALDARQAAASARRTFTGFEAADREEAAEDLIRLYYDRRRYPLTIVPCQGLNVAVSPSGPCRYGAPVRVSAGWQTGNERVNEQSHRFLGWESGDKDLLPDCADAVYAFAMPAGAVTLTPAIEAQIYTLTFDANGGQGGGAVTASHGQPFPQPAAIRPGYDLSGWLGPGGERAPDTVTGAGAYRACWLPRGDTPYRVERYFQGLDGRYALGECQRLSGRTESTAQAPMLNRAGFEPGAYAPLPIAGDGSTVVKVYYARRSYCFCLYADESGAPWREGVLPYGAALPEPRRQGYDFAGWAGGTETAMPDHDVRLQAKWRPLEVPYRVEHLLEDLQTGQYLLWEVETKLGLAGAQLDGRAHLMDYEGFEAGAVAPDSDGAIDGGGASVVRLRYRRLRYALTFIDGERVLSERRAFGEALVPPALAQRPGYAFAGWDPALPDTMPAGDAVYRAQWAAQGAAFRVRHLLEQLDGDWTEDRVDLLGGETGRRVSARPRQLEGFTYQSGHPLETDQGDIAADGSLVLSLYYRRNRHKLFLDAGEAGVAELSLAYGQAIELPEAYQRPGYILSWYPAVPAVMPDRDLTLTAQWRAKADTPYRVAHYLENAEGGFDVVQEEEKLGAGGEAVRAEPIAFPGYTRDPARGAGEGAIDPDGGLTMRLYYLRNRHRLAFRDQGMEDIVIERRYGAATAAPTLEKPGYSLSWSPPLPALMPDCDLTLEAVWTPRQADYQVRHYLQEQNGDWPQQPALCQTLRALSGDTVTAQPLHLPGFAPAEHPLALSGAEVKGDGSTVLRLYYRRQVYTLSLDSDGDGEDEMRMKVRYGAPILPQREALAKGNPGALSGAVVVPAPVPDQGAFNGWSEDGRAEAALPAAMPDRDLRYVALIARPQDLSAYQVCHLPDGGQAQWTVRYAKPGQMVTVTPNCYEGMRVSRILDGERPLPLENPQVRVREGMVITVTYSPLTFPLKVKGGEGVEVSVAPQEGELAPGALVKVTARVDEGYQWSAWLSENPYLPPSDLKDYEFIMPCGPVSLRAQAAPQRYPLELDAAGGTFVSPPPTFYAYGQALTLPVPVHPTLTFTGWSDEAGIRRVYQLGAGSRGQVALRATWSHQAVSITLDAAGGSLQGSERMILTGEPGQRLCAPADPVRAGYVFAGWLPRLPAAFPQGEAAFAAQWTLNEKDPDGPDGPGGQPQEEKEQVTAVALTPSSLCLRQGERAWLTAAVEPAGARNYTLLWLSDNPGVAVVEAGQVLALSPGEARIEARVLSGGREIAAWCQVTVTPEEEPQPPEEPDEPDPPLTLGAVIDTLAIAKGKRFSLPKFAGAKVRWAVEDQGVATLGKKGAQVKGVQLGQTTLTLTVEEVSRKKAVTFKGHGLQAGETYQIALMVRRAGELAAKVSVSPRKLNLLPNETASLQATAAPAKRVKDKQIYWASDDPSIASVDREGQVVALSPGKTTIVAYSANLRMAKIAVTVKGLVTQLQFVNGEGKKIKKAAVAKGETLPLAVRANEGALNPTVTYKSAKPKIASVDESGLVTGLRKGKAVITATAVDGSRKKAKITVTVK